MAAKTFISTRLSGVSPDINYISKTYVTLTRGIAQMVSPAIQKYRNLRNFPLGVEWLRYTKSKKEKPKQAAHISANKDHAASTLASTLLFYVSKLLIILR